MPLSKKTKLNLSFKDGFSFVLLLVLFYCCWHQWSAVRDLSPEFQRWRLFCLAFGFVLLLLAPVVSSWVPFYYSSSMAVGVFLVIIILLFQGMKLLPTGRKNVFYLTLYGSVLGAGSFLLHHFSMLVNSILVSFGLSEEMRNPVSIFVLLGIVVVGAALGYWMVRKFVIKEDGSVDVGIAQFVKWAILASLQQHLSSRSGMVASRGTVWNSSRRSSGWSDSPVKGMISLTTGRVTRNQQDYYSTFHRTPNRKKFSKKEWETFTQESTRHAMAELASSPKFTDWIIKHADRIQLLPDDSSANTIGSGSDSTDENLVESGD
ncbi:hypothetical protein LOK49_LG12G02176 [Camellia lanceoleosa]|uniref:Uncharacterized protein n=1 Tax=Camellia lanceoleosa TaxID=1840588 RepID=A0ACC0FTW6_9ERIC|nr:hypothetical protein LOK49_LG12G02176 [Camellia lanceoleosa]